MQLYRLSSLILLSFLVGLTVKENGAAEGPKRSGGRGRKRDLLRPVRHGGAVSADPLKNRDLTKILAV